MRIEPNTERREHMYLVAGSTGNTGKVVAETLLAHRLPVRVLVRSVDKGAVWKSRGAEVAVGDVGDLPSLTKALQGVTGAYLLIPPDMSVTDFRDNGRHKASIIRQALDAAKVPHTVFLSSVAAQLDSQTGPVVGLNVAEAELRRSSQPITFLRPGYFMENLAGSVAPMSAHGVLPTFFDPTIRIAMVATADIGAEAAWLLRRAQFAPRVVELAGPAEYSLSQVADAFGAALGKKIQLAPVAPDKQLETLKGFGLPHLLAAGYVEMNAALNRGGMPFEGAPRRGVISIDAFARQATAPR
jgi:uncharacterized protein YbjT (DUF2867 family)